MISEQPTRKIVKLLEEAGWVRTRTVGSHSTWRSRDGSRAVTVPDGHRTISPGVVRKIVKAIEEAGS